MVHRGGLETSSEKNKKDDFNICIADDAKAADDDEIYDDEKIQEELAPKAKQLKRFVNKASSKSTPLPLSDHSISQSVVRVERSRLIRKKGQPNPKVDISTKSTRLSPVRAGLRSNSLESHNSTTSNNNNAKGKKKKVNNNTKKPVAKPIDSPPQETVNPIVSDDSNIPNRNPSPSPSPNPDPNPNPNPNPQRKSAPQQLPQKFICSLPLDRLSGILENLKIDKSSSKCLLAGAEEDGASMEEKPNVDQNSSQCKTLCLYCDKRMSTVKVRAKHIERFHTISKERRSSARNPVAPSQDSKDAAGPLQTCSSTSAPSTPKSSTSLLFSGCSFCSKSPKLQAVALENDLSALFYHLVDLHSDKYFGCKLCAIRFQNAAKLCDHVQRAHAQPSNSTTSAGEVNPPSGPDEERSSIEFGKSTPTKTRRQIKQTTGTEVGKANPEMFPSPVKAASSASSSISRNGSMFSNDEPILSRLGVTQNRLPRGRKGIRSRRQTNVDGVKPDTSLMNVKTRSKVGRVCTSNEPIETVFRTPTNTRTEPLSCTFDEDFYEKVFINVRTNLSCHLDGKLGNDLDVHRPQSPPPLLPAIRSTVVKSPHVVESEVHTATSLAALTAFPTLLTAEQYGCDFGTAKIKRPITKHSWKWKWDSVKKYKYVNEGGKIVKKIKQPMLGLRDLSKLDMWTQLTMRQKHEFAKKHIDAAETKCLVEVAEQSREEKQRQIEQLNTILDSRRLPQIILEQNEQTVIKLEITDEGLRYLAGELVTDSDCDLPSTSLAVDRIVPANLNLIPRRALGESLRHTVVLSGEWARPRCYVCFGCGARFDKLKALEEHKMFRHPHVYSTHYEIVGRELIEGNLYKHFFIPMKALNRHREYAQGVLVNKKTDDSVSKSSSNSGNEEESLDSLHSVTASFTTLSSSKLSEDGDTDTKTAIENVSSSMSYAEPSTHLNKTDSSPTVVSSFSVDCTKCNRNCHGMLDLYRHMLDCSGDYAWILAKKKKYRYYGSRKRRQFNKHNIASLHLHKRKLKGTKDENESDETPKKKSANMSPSTPRPRPSDADSIRKMLENLPPKRVCREIIPNATKPRSRKFKTTGARKMQQNPANKCKSSNTTLTAISKKLLRNHKLRAISDKDKISRSNKILENKRKSARIKSTIIMNKKAQSDIKANKKTEAGKGGIVRKLGATTKRFVKKIKKRLLGEKQGSNGNSVEKVSEKKPSKLSAVRKLTFDKEQQDASKDLDATDGEEKPASDSKQDASASSEAKETEKPDASADEQKELIPTITIEDDAESKKSQSEEANQNSSLKPVGSVENLIQHQQRELSTSTEDLRKLPAGFLQNQVSPTTKRRSKKINDCIAMLTGKIQEKLGKPFLECKDTLKDQPAAPSVTTEASVAPLPPPPPSTEAKDTKVPKRKAFTRRIVKCDAPTEPNIPTPVPPPAKESPVPAPPITKPPARAEPPVAQKRTPVAKPAPLPPPPPPPVISVQCPPKPGPQKQLTEVPEAFKQFIPVSVKKTPQPTVTVEITTPPPALLKEIPKKPSVERKPAAKQQCVVNADTIRVPCIKAPQLNIPQFHPAQVPAPRGMISKRRQTIAGAPHDFLSEMNSPRCTNTYNNLPFELEVPLDLSKKPKRSSPKAKAVPKPFPVHLPQISVKSNAVLMPPMPFTLPILPQTQIIPIRCEPLQQKPPQIPLQNPALVFPREAIKPTTSTARKRTTNNKKQDTAPVVNINPPLINLTADTPPPKKICRKQPVEAEGRFKSNPVVTAMQELALIKGPVLSLPMHVVSVPKLDEQISTNILFNRCQVSCTEIVVAKNLNPVRNIGTDVVNLVTPPPTLPSVEEANSSPAVALQEDTPKSLPPPVIAAAVEERVRKEVKKTSEVKEASGVTETSAEKETSRVNEASGVKEASEVKAASGAEEASFVKEISGVNQAREVKEASEVKKASEVTEASGAKETTEAKETRETKESKEAKKVQQESKEVRELKESPKQNKKSAKTSSHISPNKGAPPSVENNQDLKPQESVTAKEQKTESSPESQKSLPTRRSRRNKTADQKSVKPVSDDVAPAVLKEVEEIAASFVSDDEQENEKAEATGPKLPPAEAAKTKAKSNEKHAKNEVNAKSTAKDCDAAPNQKPKIDTKISSSVEDISISGADNKETSNHQDSSKKPRRRRKNELAAIVADQLLESFKEVDKSRIDDLKRLENLAYEKSEDLLLTGMRLMPTTKRKNVLENKKEVAPTEQEVKVPPARDAKKAPKAAETSKEKSTKPQKDDAELPKDQNDAQKPDVKVKDLKLPAPMCKEDFKTKPLPIDFGNYRTTSDDSWCQRSTAQQNMALLSPENEKSPSNDMAMVHKSKSKKKQMKKRDKKIEIENINQLRTGLESFTLSKDVVDNAKEDPPTVLRTAEPTLSMVGLFTPAQRNSTGLPTNREPEVSVIGGLTKGKSTSSILRPSILAASLDIATNKETPAQNERKSSISSRDPRLNKNIHTEEIEPVAPPPEVSSRLSTLRQRRKSVADVNPSPTTRTNSRSAASKRAEANSRRNSMAFDEDDDDNYLTAIAKRVNDKIMSAEDKDFNLANDGFDLANSFLDMEERFGRPSTSMSVRSAPNFNDDRSNMDTMDATNTDLIDMDVDDDMSVYTTFSQDTSRSKGRRRRRRRSVLLTRKPKKTNIHLMEPSETYDCLLCNKKFAKPAALNKHQLTIAHVSKVSEQEYLNATRKKEELERQQQIEKSASKTPTPAAATSPKQLPNPIQNIRAEETNVSPKAVEVQEKPIEKPEKPQPTKVPYIPPNSILNQSGIEPISSPEQNYERYSSKTSSRLTLNPDQRLFYECCNILKGSETPLVERTYPIVPPTTYAYDLQAKPVTPKSTNERYSYIKQSTADASGKRDGTYPRLDVNQFSDISSDSNPACAQPPPILSVNYAQMHVLSGAKDEAVLPNDEGGGGALRSNMPRENPILQIATLASPNTVAPMTARTFVNQPSQLGPHLHGMESAATVTQKQNFISPLHSASSQSSTITTTTCRLKTKAAMKGYDNLKVSIPTIGLDMEHALERSPRPGCKLTTLAEIALGNETPMTALTSFTPAMQLNNDQKSKCKPKSSSELVEQFPSLLSQPKASQLSPITKQRDKSPVKESSPIVSIHDTESCMPIALSSPKKPESIIAKDIYEFDDSENTPISKAIQSPFKTADDNDGSPKKAIIIPERPFKNIGMEEQEGIKFQKPETPAINDENTTSTVTYSDRDDFVYGSISGGDDDNENDVDDNKEGNVNSAESSNSSAFTAKTFENKSLIMGRIFKNAKTKPKIPVEKPKLPTPEPPKQIPKQELDRLFDTLRGLNENRQASAAAKEERQDSVANSSKSKETQFAKKKAASTAKTGKSKANANANKSSNKRAANTEERCSKEMAQLHAELGMSPAEIAELIGEGQRKSQRRCAVNRSKKLVEIWSSDEFEEFLSTKDIIALIEEKEQKTKKKKKTTLSSAKKTNPPPASSNNNTKSADEQKAVTTRLQSEEEKPKTTPASPQKSLRTTARAAQTSKAAATPENPKKSKQPTSKAKKKVPIANVTPKAAPPKAQKEVKSSTSRRNSIDIVKNNTSPFKKPGQKNILSKAAASAADDSESDFEAELRKSRAGPIRNRRKTISGKLENDAGSSGCAKKSTAKSKIGPEPAGPRNSANPKAPPVDGQVRPQARRKRIASEMLYYWSSSSDEEFGRIESTHDDEDHIDETENYQQHGWIVGDSHKKLVKLLAIAKGSKKVDDCGVKEINSKKKS